MENIDGGKVFQWAGQCSVLWWDAGNLSVLVLSGKGDAGCRDGAQRSSGAGVVPEPES